ncbi:MAG: NTP transferase domain-containing protein [Thermodesulfobacteriota bacterium]
MDKSGGVKKKKRLSGVTTAVIAAAGLGSRLGGGEKLPKPLKSVAGVPLIARVMTSAARAGIRRFVVVIGFNAELMRKTLPGLVPEGSELRLVENQRFREPNGVSLLLAARSIEEPFALLMSDHIFSHDRLSLAIEHFKESGRPLIAVDAKEGFDGDMEDATLVSVKDGQVRKIGKDLLEYDAVDTGLFVLWPDTIAEALETAGPGASISAGMQVLADRGALDAFYPKRGFWQDVDTGEDVRAAEKKLYASLTKPADGFMASRVNRRISLFFSTRLWRCGVTPNMVTSFTLILGFLAGAAFAEGSGPGWGLLGAALFQLHSVIDGVDGELARLLQKESTFGFWFDVTVDNITHVFVFGGIALGQRASHEPGPWVVLGILAALGVAASFVVMSPLLKPGRPSTGGEKSGLKKFVEKITSRDFSYLLFPLAIAGWLGIFLWIATIGTWIYTILVIVLRRRTPGKEAALNSF